MERAEYDFDISVESISGTNSYWVPTPQDEIEDLKSLQQIFASIPLEKLNHRKLKNFTVL